MKIAHLSDIHYLPRYRVPARRFLNKRITGYLNLKLLRSFQHDSGMLDQVIEALGEADPDHLAITGDLTNLSLAIEFAELRHFLGRLGMPPDRITVVPGNHDRYTRGADNTNRIRAYLEPYMRGDVDSGSAFPIVRLRDGIALVGIDTAMSRPPLLAGGRIGQRQLARLKSVFVHDEVRRAFPVILLHHPPYRRTRHAFDFRFNGLRDYQELYRLLAGRRALILHGHLHRNSYLHYSGDGARWQVVGVASATRHGRVRPYRLSSFHVFEVDGSGVSSIRRYTLDPGAGSYTVKEIGESDFGALVPGRDRTCLEDPS